jgi:hypothetical protein
MGKVIGCALSACQLILDCVSAANCPPTDASCISECEGLADESGSTAYNALNTCMLNDCANACNGT